MVKKFVLNADDFGISKAINRAVLEGYEFGFLKSASLAANGEEFEEAVKQIIPQCPDLSVGIHLNITKGKSLCRNINTIASSYRKFKHSFISLCFILCHSNNEEMMMQIEREFRCQIESILSKTKIAHIDSHSHVHAIPKLFDLVCRLANEYGIKEVRTHYEVPYKIPEFYRHINLKYFKHSIKAGILRAFTEINRKTLEKYGLQTNDCLIGVSYASMMDAKAISYGLNAIDDDDITVEAILHPRRYEEGTVDKHFDQYMVTKNKKLIELIEKSGYEITNYNGLYETQS